MYEPLLSVGDRVASRRPFGEHGHLRGTIRAVTGDRGYTVEWDSIGAGDGWSDDDIVWSPDGVGRLPAKDGAR